MEEFWVVQVVSLQKQEQLLEPPVQSEIAVGVTSLEHSVAPDLLHQLEARLLARFVFVVVPEPVAAET